MRTVRGKRGFTLIEVLIALALSSALLAALYSSFFLAHRAVGGVDNFLLEIHEIRTAMDVMRRELESALDNKSIEEAAFSLKDRDFYGRQTSEVEFTSVGLRVPGLWKVAYYVEENDGKLDLFKKILPARSGYKAGTDDKEAIAALVVEDIGSFSVETGEGSGWYRTWNSSEMPKEIKITITAVSGEKNISLSETVRPRVGSRI